MELPKNPAVTSPLTLRTGVQPGVPLADQSLGSVRAQRGSLPCRCRTRREPFPILTGRDFQDAHERRPQLLFTAVAALLGDGFDAVVSLFQAPPRRIKSNRFHRLGGSPTAFLGVHTREVAGTHYDCF